MVKNVMFGNVEKEILKWQGSLRAPKVCDQSDTFVYLA